MRTRLRILLLALALPVLMMSDGGQALRARSANSSDAEQRIRFRITTVEERGNERSILSETSIEGPPGTDFDLHLQHAGFKMKAHFLTDLVGRDTLRVRATLDTRRLYGYSEQKLPLYEEDTQDTALEVGFDESVVLMPFGRTGGGDVLKIEIAPMRSERPARLASGKRRPLEIEITKPAPGGFISVEAFKQPHRFTVEAALFEDGREIARGASNNLLEEAQEFTLQPNAQAGEEVQKNPLTVNLSVAQFIRSRPTDQAAISFDIYRAGEGERQTIASKWSGIMELGSVLSYDLKSYQPVAGRKYEIRFRVRLAPNESSD
ncbi:MAG: hypothetical protein ICV60_17270 [Pyrinomonadaceae bacterium]|nr:hypothetical protein [Pyrinomonadaceae bacterium]